jgi:hypothetical protein
MNTKKKPAMSRLPLSIVAASFYLINIIFFESTKLPALI